MSFLGSISNTCAIAFIPFLGLVIFIMNMNPAYHSIFYNIFLMGNQISIFAVVITFSIIHIVLFSLSQISRSALGKKIDIKSSNEASK